MGGEGSMLQAIKSLKNNRALLKRKDKSGLSGSYSNIQLKEFPKATPEQLRFIREKIQLNEKKKTRNLIVSLIVFLVLLFFIFWYVMQ